MPGLSTSRSCFCVFFLFVIQHFNVFSVAAFFLLSFSFRSDPFCKFGECGAHIWCVPFMPSLNNCIQIFSSVNCLSAIHYNGHHIYMHIMIIDYKLTDHRSIGSERMNTSKDIWCMQCTATERKRKKTCTFLKSFNS